MNKVERKDLVVGTLYWYVVYQGDSFAPSMTLVQPLEVNPTYRLHDVYENKVIQVLPVYSHFEAVHPDWLEANIKSVKSELSRLTVRLQILESLEQGTS